MPNITPDYDKLPDYKPEDAITEEVLSCQVIFVRKYNDRSMLLNYHYYAYIYLGKDLMDARYPFESFRTPDTIAIDSRQHMYKMTRGEMFRRIKQDTRKLILCHLQFLARKNQ